MAPRLSGRIAACTLALLVAGAVHGPAASARPSEVGSQPGAAASEGMGADRTVARSYRVIAPAYEVNSRGVGYAVWVEQHGNKYAVHGAYQSATGGWAEGRRISNAFAWGGLQGLPGEPDVAVDDRGRAVVVWAQKVGRAVKIYTAKGTKNRWGPPKSISGNNDLGMYPEVAVSPNGRHALVSWTGNYLTVDAMTLMASMRTKAGTWARPKRAIPTDATYKPSTRQPPPVIDNHGTATVAWVEVERVPTPEGQVFLRIQSSTAWRGGAWAPEELYRGVPRAYASNVSLATSPDGELLVAITIGGSDEQLLTRRRSASGAWAAPVTAYVPSPETNLQAPIAAVGPDGRGVVVQETFIQTGPQNYASQHLLVLEDALGGGWHAEVVSDPVDTTGIGLEGQPDLAVGPKGDIAVAWRFPTLDPRGLPATVRHRLADGRWLDARTLGRYSAEPLLAFDARGHLRALWSKGEWYRDHVNCCHVLKSKPLP